MNTAVTYFYPSTEWELKQPFECKCGASVSHFLHSIEIPAVIDACQSCLGYISGARDLPAKELMTREGLGAWIRELAAQRAQ